MYSVNLFVQLPCWERFPLILLMRQSSSLWIETLMVLQSAKLRVIGARVPA